MLRILFLTQTYPIAPHDTTGPFIRDLARGLVRGGDRVTVLLPHAAGVPEAWQDDGVSVRSFRYAPESAEVIGYSRSLEADEKVRLRAGLAVPLYLWGARRALAAELRREPVDLVHAHWVVPNGVAAASLTSRIGPRRGRVPLAVGLHGSDVFLAEKKLARPLVAPTLARTSLLTGCSPELVDRVRRLGFAGDRFRVIPYGVDSETFAPAGDAETRAEAAAWRRRLGISDEAVLLLGVGRMATKKGFQVLIAALHEIFGALAAEGPEATDLHVVLAGGGDLLAELQAASRPYAERVHFPGAVTRDSLPHLYRAADLFVLPAVHDRRGNVDGLPNVILEAMASGLPVVASGISGIPLAIDSGVEGRLVPEGETGPLAAAILDYVRDGELRREAGKAARHRVQAALTWDAVARRYREGYEVALGR